MLSDTPAFRGDRSRCLANLSTITGYYTYALRRPDGRPFYVGKGKGARVLNHENEARHPNNRRSNSHKLNVIRSILRSDNIITYEIDRTYTTEVDAYVREMELITFYGRLHEGGLLTNRAPGGGTASGASPFSRAKHSATLGGIPEDDPETAVLNRFVLAIGSMDSVVLKPRSRFIPKPTRSYPTKKTGPSMRQAIALAATASANGLELIGGVLLPRTVDIDGVLGFVENGVSCDIATSKMATIIAAADPAMECFLLTTLQTNAIVGLIGFRKAKDLGITL